MGFLRSLFGGSKTTARSQPKCKPALENLEGRDAMSGLVGGFAGLDLYAISQGSFAGLDNGYPTNFALTSPTAWGGPGSIGGLFYQNYQWDGAAFNNYWNQSVNIALNTPDNVALPFNAWTNHQAINGLNDAYYGLNSYSTYYSNAAINSIGGWYGGGWF
jgi:hypothetical protein